MLVVAGGAGNFTGLFKSSGWPTNGFVTKKIELPADWNKLVAKYRNIVPTYARY